MDVRYLLRNIGLYMIIFGGGTIGISYLFPPWIRPVAMILAVLMGVCLLIWGAVSETGPLVGGFVLTDTPKEDRNSWNELRSGRPGILYYALGLVIFGSVWVLVTYY